MKKFSLDKMKNKGAAATAATVAAAGVLIGGAFETPADILKNDDAALAPPPIVETLTAETEPDGGDDGDETVADEQEEKRKGGVRERTREFVLRLPLALRACVALPLWGVGWAIISLAALLWTGVVSPVGGAILKWVLLALVILSAIMITVKTVFPKTPIKKILNKYTLLWVLGGSTLLCAADVALQYFCPEAPRLYDIFRLAASLSLLIAALVPVLRRLRREKRTEEIEEAEAAEAALDEEEEESAEEAERRVEREILELADSVR